MVQLAREMIEKLDQRAARRQVSRSSLIREAVQAYLNSDDDALIAEAYRQGYGRFPLGTKDEWGDLESFHQEVAAARPGAGGAW